MAKCSPEEALFAILKAAAPVFALIGDRAFPLVLPQGERRTSLVYQTVDTPRHHCMTGSSGLANPRIQFRVWAAEYGDAKRAIDAIRLTLDGKSFEAYTLADGREITLQAIFAEDGRDSHDSERNLFGVALDLIVWHDEERPA